MVPLQFHHFCDLQAKRPNVYSSLEYGFNLLLKGEATMAEYQQLLQTVTLIFADISNNILTLISNIKALGPKSQPGLALILEIQELERENLKLTCQWQSLAYETLYGTRDMSSDSKVIKASNERVIEEIRMAMQELRAFMADFE